MNKFEMAVSIGRLEILADGNDNALAEIDVLKTLVVKDQNWLEMAGVLGHLEILLEDNERALAEVAKIRELLPTSENLSRNARIEFLDFTIRTYNALYRYGVRTVGNLADMKLTTLYNIRNIGAKSAEEVIRKMREAGYEMKE